MFDISLARAPVSEKCRNSIKTRSFKTHSPSEGRFGSYTCSDEVLGGGKGYGVSGKRAQL
jgi:hypothetical protein